MSTRSRGCLPDAAGLYGIFLFLVLVRFAGGRTLADGDTLWHIRAGTIMLERGELLTRDIFSHTAYGNPWTAHEWLAEIVMGALHRFGGLGAVGLFYLLLASLTFWLLFRIAERFTRPWVALLCVSVALMLSMTHLLARPHIFSWLFGVITLYLLVRNDRTLWLLIPLTAFWANFHGGVLLGPALQGIYCTGTLLEGRFVSGRSMKDLFRENRRPLLVLISSIAALGLNPFGYDLIGFHFQVTGDLFISKIGEWQSPDFQTLWYYRYYLLAVILVLALPGSRTDWVDRLLLLVFLNASLTHQRHISLAALFLTPFWAKTLQSYASRLPRRRIHRESAHELVLSAGSGPILTTILALSLMAATGTDDGRRVMNEFFPLPEKFSPPAIRYLRESPPPGKMFNDYEWGDYLIYELAGERKVFIDGRADMYGEEIFLDYLKIRNLGRETDDLLQSYGIGWVLLPPDQPLIIHLEKSKKWAEAYRDAKVSILVRSPSAENDQGGSPVMEGRGFSTSPSEESSSPEGTASQTN